MQAQNTIGPLWAAVTLTLSLAPACSSSEEVPVSDGELIRAEILSPAVIRYADREVPLDLFLHELRKKAEQAGPGLDRAPRVRLIPGPAMKESPSVMRIVEAVHQTGIHFIELAAQ
jgi:hypothetical protein